MKKTFSFLLSLCMILSFVPIQALAENDGISITVTSVDDFPGNPQSKWYHDADKIISAVVAEGISEIPQNGFWYCKKMQSVVLPASITSIGKNAFGHCEKLDSITLPRSLTRIEDDAFDGCVSLASIDIPDGVTFIGFYAFNNCKALKSVKLPSSWHESGGYTFQHCESLHSISVPEGVTDLPKSAFSYSEYLQEVTLPTTLRSIGDEAFNGCAGLKSLSIPDGVTATGFYAFNNCKVLESVKLPSSWQKSGGYTFQHCESLHSISVPEGVTDLPKSAFSYSEYLQEVTLPTTLRSIGDEAFNGCAGLKSLSIPDGVIATGFYAFNNCKALESVKLPSSWQKSGGYTFQHCESLHSISVPEGVTDLPKSAFSYSEYLQEVTLPSSLNSIGEEAFNSCTNLKEVSIPKSVKTIDFYGFNSCKQLTNVYYAGSNADWDSIKINQYGNDPLNSATIHYNSAAAPGTTPTPTTGGTEYLYDTSDPGESVTLDAEALESVSDTQSAAAAVSAQTQSMTAEQKTSATGADLATLYAETAVAKAASKEISGAEILINKAAVTELETIARQTSEAVESALVSGGVSTARYISSTVTLQTEETGKIAIKIDPDILETEVDRIVVEAPTYAITLKVADLKEDLTKVLTITAQDVGSGFAPGSTNKKTTVKVDLPNGKTSNPVTVSLPKDSGNATYQAVVNTSGTATASKYNPATKAMDGKINTSGSYTVQTNQKDFSDIANKSAEMQAAIRYLASKGIISGTDTTHFSPDGSITRAEIAALMVRALGKVDNSAKPTFKDVTTANWYYSTAASSQKAGLINGYEDNTFRGGNQINKEQIVAVSARVLKNQMGYKAPTNPVSYLGKYSDSVVSWAQGDVALATRENLVVYRADGTFNGSKGMTRGDAAIIIYRLFQRIW